MARALAVRRRLASAALACLAACASNAAPRSDAGPVAIPELPESVWQAAVLQRDAAIHEDPSTRSNPVLVCRQSLAGKGPSPDSKEALLRRFPEIPRDLLDALTEANRSSVDLSDRFDSERIALVDRDWIRSLAPNHGFFEGVTGWPALEETYPDATGIWLCGNAVTGGGRALINLYYDAGFGDFSEYCLLELIDGRWRVARDFITGIE